MNDVPHVLTDRNLEVTTSISLRKESACFAYLCAQAISPPVPIDAINLDLASVDYYAGRASLWATLDIRSSVNNDEPTAVLGFDETFLRPFTRSLIEAAVTRGAYRMTIRSESFDQPRFRVVEYVTGPGVRLHELLITPHDNVLLIGMAAESSHEETLFQLPRSDQFLRSFSRMAYEAENVLRRTLSETERLGRQRIQHTPS